MTELNEAAFQAAVSESLEMPGVVQQAVAIGLAYAGGLAVAKHGVGNNPRELEEFLENMVAAAEAWGEKYEAAFGLAD